MAPHQLQQIADTGFLRIKSILGDPFADPPTPAIIPIGKTAWWNGVKSGKYPQPVKLGPRTTAWRRSDILELCKRLSCTAQSVQR